MPHSISLSAEAQFKTIVVASPIPAAVSRYDGTILYANQSFADTFGVPLPEVIGSHIPDYYYDPADLMPVLDILKRDGRVQNREIMAKKRDGAPVWALVSIAAIDLDGATYDLIEFNDITGRKRMEEALAQRTRLLEALNQLARDVTATLDLDAILHTAVQSVTDILNLTSAYISIWDERQQRLTVIAEYYSPDAAPEERVSDLGHAYHLEADFGVTAEWLNALYGVNLIHVDDEGLSEMERAHIAKYGGKTVLEVPLHAKGKPVGMLDLWESRARREFSPDEMELMQAIAYQVALAIDNARLYEQAKEANRMKTEFLAKVSHELRTPLGVILGYAEMMQEGMYGELSEGQGKAVANIIENTAVLAHQVNDLLDAARLEAGKLHLTLDMFLLADMVAQIQKRFELQAELKKLTFTIDVAADMPPTLYGDWSRIDQILYHLLANAFKYTQSGAVTLRIYRSEPAHWALAVADTGPGIPPAARAAIFETFRQADDTVTRRYPGQGLGLSLVRQLVRLMDGEIFLESQEGQGSTFIILLPLHEM